MHSPVKPDQANRPAPFWGAATLGPRRVHTTIAILIFVAGASFAMLRASRNQTTDAVALPRADATPMFIKDGNIIRVPEGSPIRRQLTIQAVDQKEIARDLVIPAVVEADPARLMKVLPPLTGRVTELKVRLGERIERGQPLLVLDSPDLRSAYAEYDRGKVLLDLAIKNRDRLRSLGVGGGIAPKDIQQADADFIGANAEYQRAEARLRQIGVDPGGAEKSRVVTITAPISGSILDLSVASGAYWNDTAASMLAIADLSRVFVTANLPEKDTTRVAEGQAVRVNLVAYPGEVLEGVVSFVSDALDADTRRTKVRIAFDNPSIRLKPGMFASVTFLTPKEAAPVVPTRALLLRDEITQVFVEVAPWRFEPRPVDVRFQRGDDAVIQSGLKTGERVIVRGGVLLND